MSPGKTLLLLVLILAGLLPSRAQRNYPETSVLASGEWYKIKVPREGIYAIDREVLQRLGASGDLRNLRLFGNHGAMLPENPSAPLNSLQEIPLAEVQGPSGMIYCFYSPGTVKWTLNPAQNIYIPQKNSYSDTAVYFLQINSPSPALKPEQLPEETGAPDSDIRYYYHRYYHETDSFNLLNSGKEWWGEDMGFLPGKPTRLNFLLPEEAEFIPGRGILYARLAARSFNIPARIAVSVNNLFSEQLAIPPVGTGQYDVFAREGEILHRFSWSGNAPSLQFDFTEGGGNAQSWLDKFALLLPAKLKMKGSQLVFRNPDLPSDGSVKSFTIENAGGNTQIWLITDPFRPEIIPAVAYGSTLSFKYRARAEDEFVVFSVSGLPKPVPAGKVAHQNILAPARADYLIVAPSAFIPAAERLAEFHRSKGLQVTLTPVEEIFNEFSSGIPDPVAIRDYVKMFYDRAGGDSSLAPKYLLLFGTGSFDPKNKLKSNFNFIPAWQSRNSLDPLSTYTADDFFGFLDDEDDINSLNPPLLDIGIGRIPAATLSQANAFVDKLIQYHQPSSLGAWRMNISFVADDEDNNLHVEDAESLSETAEKIFPGIYQEKYYLDAYEQQATPAGQTYPDARKDILNNLFKGVLIWNYNGHGGYRRLAEEAVMDFELLDRLKNAGRLPLFIVATCDFTPFDNPFNYSLGEELLFKPSAGGIAVLSSTRLVFAASNHLIHKNFLEALLSNRQKPLGDILKYAKNLNYGVFGDVLNNRKMMLFGDPAMPLAFPEHEIITTSINGNTPGEDTLKAMQKVVMEGEVRDRNGNLLQDFEGTVYPLVLDKPLENATRGNDPGSRVQNFKQQVTKIFSGSASVKSGKFSFEFLVPRDIQYVFGKGKILLYAENGITDASGIFEDIVVGGTGGGLQDNAGPEIKAYLNDENFVSGGIVNSAPILLVEVQDESGINITGTGPGHNFTAVLDDEEEFVLNGYYVSEKDDFTKGKVRYQLPALEPGWHNLKITAWDGANNAGTAMLEFRVVGDEKLVLNNVLNYPNPFTTSTCFWFDHNRPGEELSVQIQIYTISGKLVKTLRNTIFSTGNRSNEIFWDGRDDFGQKLGRGVYIYAVTVQTSDGKLARKMERLYLL